MATNWEEYDVAELGRLMIDASKLESAVDEMDLVSPTEQDREDMFDARYHAHKLVRILSRLAVKAEREFGEVVASEESGD